MAKIDLCRDGYVANQDWHDTRLRFQREPDFGVTSVNYSFPELIVRARKPD